MIKNLDDKLKNAFAKIESNSKLLELFEHDSYNSWIHVKFSVYKKFSSSNSIKAQQNSKLSLYVVYVTIISFVNLIRDRESQVAFFTSSRGVDVNSKEFSDKYIQEFISEDKPHKILVSFNSKQESKLYLKNKKSIVFDNLLINFYKKLFLINKWNRRGPNHFKDIFDVFIEFGISVPEEWIVKVDRDYFKSISFYNRLFKRLKNLSSIYLVSAYSKSYVVDSAKSLGIITYEIQHGISGKSHLGYDYNCDIKLIPVPNFFMVYNQYWKNQILNCNFTKEVRVFDSEKFRLDKFQHIEEFGDYILFTGQGMHHEAVYNFISESFSQLGLNNLKIIYLPHPTENTNNVDFIELDEKHEEFIYLKNSSYSTFNLIYSSIAHISISSNCHFDAISLNKERSFVLNIRDQNNPHSFYFSQNPDKFVVIDNIDRIIGNSNQ